MQIFLFGLLFKELNLYQAEEFQFFIVASHTSTECSVFNLINCYLLSF
jgi:hypothetical protein